MDLLQPSPALLHKPSGWLICLLIMMMSSFCVNPVLSLEYIDTVCDSQPDRTLLPELTMTPWSVDPEVCLSVKDVITFNGSVQFKKPREPFWEDSVGLNRIRPGVTVDEQYKAYFDYCDDATEAKYHHKLLCEDTDGQYFPLTFNYTVVASYSHHWFNLFVFSKEKEPGGVCKSYSHPSRRYPYVKEYYYPELRHDGTVIKTSLTHNLMIDTQEDSFELEYNASNILDADKSFRLSVKSINGTPPVDRKCELNEYPCFATISLPSCISVSYAMEGPGGCSDSTEFCFKANITGNPKSGGGPSCAFVPCGLVILLAVALVICAVSGTIYYTVLKKRMAIVLELSYTDDISTLKQKAKENTNVQRLMSIHDITNLNVYDLYNLSSSVDSKGSSDIKNSDQGSTCTLSPDTQIHSLMGHKQEHLTNKLLLNIQLELAEDKSFLALNIISIKPVQDSGKVENIPVQDTFDSPRLPLFTRLSQYLLRSSETKSAIDLYGTPV